MLWRAHFFRTFQSTVCLKREPTSDKFAVTKQNFHFQVRNIKCTEPKKAPCFIKKRFLNTELNGLNYFSKTLAKFLPENISKQTGLPSVEELTKHMSLDQCLPVEIFQNGFVYLHSTCGLPWWSVIAVSALITRFALLPLVIFAEKKNAQLSNNIPRIRYLQNQLSEANKTNDDLKLTRITKELSLFNHQEQITWGLLRTGIVTLVQAPLFILFLNTIRTLPQEQLQSMRQGGPLWFNDLTAADPKFVLPILATITMSAVIELTFKNAKYISDNTSMIWILRANPLIIMPFVANFSSAFLLFWTCYNFVTIAEASILRISAVRRIFKIEKLYSLLPRFQSPVIIKTSKFKNVNEKLYAESELKERIHKMRYSKARKGSGNTKASIKREIVNVSQIPQCLKLKAIMEISKSKI